MLVRPEVVQKNDALVVNLVVDHGLNRTSRLSLVVPNTVVRAETVVPDCVARITWLEVHPGFRGRGCALHLLLVAARIALARRAATIELDDMSDRAGAPDNLYVSVGFAVVRVGLPEMVADAQVVAARAKTRLLALATTHHRMFLTVAEPPDSLSHLRLHSLL
jgi:hypothetical protein